MCCMNIYLTFGLLKPKTTMPLSSFSSRWRTRSRSGEEDISLTEDTSFAGATGVIGIAGGTGAIVAAMRGSRIDDRRNMTNLTNNAMMY